MNDDASLRRTGLSDNQRRFVCRLAFLLFCILPTGLVVYWIVHQPGTVQWEQWIQANLGIRVEIGSVETPDPYVTIFRSVKIIESGLEDSLDTNPMLFHEIKLTQSAQQNEVFFIQPVEIPVDSLASILNRCNLQLEQMTTQNKSWNVLFSKLTLSDSQQFVMKPANLKLELVDSNNSKDRRAFSARLFAHTVGPTPENIIKVDYKKTTQNESFEIDTGQGTLPCRLFSHWYSDAQWLSDTSHFRGKLALRIFPRKTVNGQFHGDIFDVQLNKLDPMLAGTCSLRNVDCDISDSQIDRATFKIFSEDNIRVGKQIVDQAEFIGVRSNIDRQSNSLTFRSVDFDVKIENGLIQLLAPDSVLGKNAMDQPIAFCNQEPHPIHHLAVVFTGERQINDRVIAFVRRFKIPAPTREANLIQDSMR
ncbi:MAG: hypothetical protein AAGA30_12110 [Planctomycetota bacterium]